METQTPWMEKLAAAGTMTVLVLLSLSALGTILLKLQF
jgi:hypothetical protein